MQRFGFDCLGREVKLPNTGGWVRYEEVEAAIEQARKEGEEKERGEIRSWCNSHNLDLSVKRVMDAYENSLRSRSTPPQPKKIEPLKYHLGEVDESRIKINEIADAVNDLRSAFNAHLEGK